MLRYLPLLAAGLVAVHAQAPNSLPQCGQTCVNNMLSIATSQFGCDANDIGTCACCNPDFGFGIRDCAQAVCGEGSQDYSSVVSYGSSYCASAVTSCPSGTQATSVLAAATGSGSGSGSMTGSGSAATPAMTSGAMGSAVGGAAGAVSAVSGSPGAYVVNGQTITAGGSNYATDGTTYSALPSGGGVAISGGNMQTTVMPGSGAGAAGASNSSGSGMMTMTSGGGSGGSGGAFGAAAGSVSAVSGAQNQYVIDGNTISPGGNTFGMDGTVYSALPSGGGVLLSANGQSSTVNPASASASSTGGMGGGAGGMSSSSSGSSGGNNGGAAGGNSGNNGGNSGGSNGGSSSSGQSGNMAPVQTAAPALIGAAAMAILAL